MPDMWDQFADAGPGATPPAGRDIWAQFADAPTPSVAEDVAKSGGIGLAKGALDIAGTGGLIGDLASAGTDWLGNKLGVSPEAVKSFKQAVALTNPFAAPFMGPDPAQLQKGVEQVTGEFYQPKTIPGQYAQTVGEFVPAALGGPEGLAGRLASRVVAPALASETAGQLTKGTAAEPFARAAGAGATSVPSLLRGAAKAAAPTAEALGQAAEANYTAARNLGVEIKSDAVKTLAQSAKSDLHNDGFRDYLAPKTYAVLNELENPPAGSVAELSDLVGMRRVLGKAAGSPDATEREAAGRVMRSLDNYMSSIPSSDVVAGDASMGARLLELARGDYAAMKRSDRVTDALDRADLQAAAANSGQNIDNATRQRLKAILASPAQRRGFSQDELLQMQRVVRGTPVGNTARFTGNLLGGGGGLGALVTGGLGAAAAGPGGVVAPLVGYGLKKLGNASTARQAALLDEMIRRRSPLAQGAAATVPAAPNRFGPQTLLPPYLATQPSLQQQ